MDPRGGQKLEILCQTAREFDTLCGSSGSAKHPRISHFVETLVIKGRGREFRLFPVAGCYVRGPRTRSSYLPALSVLSTGTIFNSIPGVGSPITLVRLDSKWTSVT